MRRALGLLCLLLASCAAPEAEQCVIERRGVSREVVRVSGDCGQQDFTGVDLGRADVSGVTWGGATCPDGAQAAQVGGSCEGHLSPRQDNPPDLPLDADPDVIEDAPEDTSADAPPDQLPPGEDALEPSPDAPGPGDVVEEPVEDLGDPCAALGCPPGATCDPEAPACVCAEGEELREGECVVAGCGGLCHAEARCVATEAGPRCVCGEGFEGDGAFCVGREVCGSLSFDGFSNYVDGFIPAVPLAPPLTVELWIRPRSWSSGTLFLYGDTLSRTPHYFLVRLREVGELEIELVTDAAMTRVVASLPVGVRAWVHVAVQVPEFEVWVDGARAARTISGDRRWDPALEGGELLLGARVDGLAVEELYAGQLREVRLSNVLRYNGIFIPAWRHDVDAATVALWRMNAQGGEEVRDVGPGGHHGLLQGGALWVRCSEE
jgi:hypothetical protein